MHVRPFRAARLVILFFSVLALAAPAQAQPGKLTGFSFLRLEPSARAAALGGSFAAVYGDDVNALFYNPALLNEQMHGALSLSYLNHLGDLNAGFLAYSRHYEHVGTLGAGLRFLSWGDLQGADEDGNLTGTFGASDVALTVGIARPYSDRLRYGVNVHAVLSSIDAYHASALGVDLGVLYHLADQQFTLSASVNNLGATLSSFGSLRDALPLDVRVGLTKRLQYLPLLVSVTGYNLHELSEGSERGTFVDDVLYHLTLGGEFQFSDAFNVRLGYNHRRHEALKMKSRLDFAGAAIGFGIKVSRFRFDYAFNTWSSLGGLHQFTVRTSL